MMVKRDTTLQEACTYAPSGDPSVARVNDWLLGGKDNYHADREQGEQLLEVLPQAVQIAAANRAFMARAVSYLAGEAGVRQFLDLGAGLPTAQNTHQVAQAAAPDARVVYVDNDAPVVAHGRALLAGDNTAAIDADVRDPDQVLGDRHLQELFDLDRPVALLLLDVLHLMPDTDIRTSVDVVGNYVDRVAPGSHLVISHPLRTEQTLAAAEVYRAAPVTLRGESEIARHFNGTELLPPGIVPLPQWRPTRSMPASAATMPHLCGVGCKP